MAIPFHLPSDEETEDNYRRLDQLLLDLYHVLRQILMRPRCTPEDTPTEEPRARGRGGVPAPSRSRQVGPGTAPEPGDVTQARRRRQRSLPDVVASAVSSTCGDCPCRCPSRRRRHSQRRHRRRRRPSTTECPSSGPAPVAADPAEAPSPSARRPPDNWLVIGEEIRKIAEEFKTSYRKQEESLKADQSLKMQVKTSGLFSLLVPGHLRSSIWTTVILLVGWRLLVRAR